MASEHLKYITFSGGGWNSHTASSGWINAALQGLRNKNPHIPEDKITVETLFKNIDGLAGNSGGAWFLSMLAYSEDFEQALTNHPDRWFEQDEGYMGQLRQEFDELWQDQPFEEIIDNTSITLADQIIKTLFNDNELTQRERDALLGVFAVSVESVLSEMSEYGEIMQLLPLISEDSRPSWSKAVRDLCFKPFAMNNTLNHSLDVGKNKWATNKDLQITVAMPSKKVYLSGNGASRLQNDGHRVITGQLLKGSATSIPDDSETFPGFIRANGGSSEIIFTGTDDNFKTNYTNDKNERMESVLIPNILDNHLSILDSVSVSSSAAGLLASTNFLQTTIEQNFNIPPDIFPGTKSQRQEIADGLYEWISQVLARYFGDLAIPVSLQKKDAKLMDNAPADIEKIKSQVGSRLIDGGYVDNTAVTSALYSIQHSNSSKNNDQDRKDFSITILSNVTGGLSNVRTEKGKDIEITTDIKDLFGMNDSPATKRKGGGMDFIDADIKTVSPHIFHSDALKVIDNEWSYMDKDNDAYLRHFKLDVETVENKAFGIAEGSKGELNIFMNVAKKSSAAPFDKTIFNLYEKLYETTSKELSKGDIHDNILASLGIPSLLHGSRKNETLKGTRFSERIKGYAGDDVIEATRGPDVLVGGRGMDLFKYDRITDSPNKTNHTDTIRRFNPDEGDRIDLTEIADLDFIGRGKFTGPNQVRWNGSRLMINLDEDRQAEMSISIQTSTNLIQSDNFIAY